MGFEAAQALRKLRSTTPLDAVKSLWTPDNYRFPKRAKKIVIQVSGGVGDTVIAAPIAREIERTYGPCLVYANFPEVFREMEPQIECLPSPEFKGYDAWIRLNAVARFHLNRPFRGFHSEGMERLYFEHRLKEVNPELRRMIQYHPELDNFLGEWAMKRGLNRYTLPRYLMGLPLDQTLLHRPVYRPAKYDWEPFITVHDGFELNQTNVSVRATKTWNLRHWEDVVTWVHEQYPQLRIVQLGGKTSRPIRGVDYQLVGRTTLLQSFNILSRSLLHLDGDSGLVHAARAYGVPSVVLFGPTPKGFFGYEGNENLGGSDYACKECWWVNRTWLASCPVGLSQPECMDAIQPQSVFLAIERSLSKRTYP